MKKSEIEAETLSSDEEIKKGKPGYRIIKNTADIQRLKLEKLMKNPDKPVIIPERPKPRDVPIVPDFVRNVMGSSAGAGSGEFHVYRHLRRKEYARQRYMKEKAERERLDEEFQKKLEANKLVAEAKTSKKRAKRLKRKEKMKQKGKKARTEGTSQSEKSESEEDSNSDSEHKSNEETSVEKAVNVDETKRDDDNAD